MFLKHFALILMRSDTLSKQDTLLDTMLTSALWKSALKQRRSLKYRSSTPNTTQCVVLLYDCLGRTNMKCLTRRTHPSVFYRLSVTVQPSQKRCPDSPGLSQLLQLIQEDPEALPGQPRDMRERVLGLPRVLLPSFGLASS